MSGSVRLLVFLVCMVSFNQCGMQAARALEYATCPPIESGCASVSIGRLSHGALLFGLRYVLDSWRVSALVD